MCNAEENAYAHKKVIKNDVVIHVPVWMPSLPCDRTPAGSWPEGVSPLSANTESCSCL